jgi:GxxExxY protein
VIGVDFMRENEIAKMAMDICFLIHKKFGPGLFESVYEELFCFEWSKNGIYFVRQHPVPLSHETIKLEAGFRADCIIDNRVILEFKSIESLAEVHYKEGLTYLKLTNLKLGLLINFNVPLMKNGIHRIVNNL